MSNRIGSTNDGSSKPEHNPALDPRVVAATARYVRITWAWRTLIVLLLVACLAYLVQNSRRQGDTLDAVRDTQVDAKSTIDNSAQAVQILKDCTANQNSACAKRNAEGQREVLRLLHKDTQATTLTVVVAVVTCQQDGITGALSLARCAEARLR